MSKKRILALACAIAILAILHGCQRKEYRYTFDQPFSNVVKVEIMRYHYATQTEDSYTTTILELDLHTAESLLKEVSELPCYKHFMDPPTGYGEVILYITYANGEGEVIGFVNSASVREDGIWRRKVYYFNKAQWCEMLLKYVDAELVPELDKYMQNS